MSRLPAYFDNPGYIFKDLKNLDYAVLAPSLWHQHFRMLIIAQSLNKALYNPMPFDGIQLLLVGDFQQLRTVPSLFDKAQFMCQSPIFQQAIPHEFKLT